MELNRLDSVDETIKLFQKFINTYKNNNESQKGTREAEVPTLPLDTRKK